MKCKFIFISAICVLLASLLVNASADVYVHGYYKKDGTYVAPYHRTYPDQYKWNNYSYKGSTVSKSYSYAQNDSNYTDNENNSNDNQNDLSDSSEDADSLSEKIDSLVSKYSGFLASSDQETGTITPGSMPELTIDPFANCDSENNRSVDTGGTANKPNDGTNVLMNMMNVLKKSPWMIWLGILSIAVIVLLVMVIKMSVKMNRIKHSENKQR